jgi:hypothetical protein
VQSVRASSAIRAWPDEAGSAAGDLVRDAIGSSGESIDPTTRAFMESHFGRSFGHVRVHRGPAADASARAVDALAYTTGHHIVFADTQYAPKTSEGRKRLAHELSHVVQQAEGPVDGHAVGDGLQVSHPDDAFEREAHQVASGIERSPTGETAGRDAGAARRHAAGTAPLPPTPSRPSAVPATPVQRVAPAVVAGIAGGAALLAGGAYLLWAKHCLDPLNQPMYDNTFNKFLPKYQSDMGKPVANRVWDAFGHCWVACAGTEKCGATATAVAGKSREFWREYAPSWLGNPKHDSYEQDTNNQTTGRGFGSKKLDCYDACDKAARSGGLDLTAPEGTCFTVAAGEYPAPCEPGGPGPGAPAPGAGASPAGAPGAGGAPDAGVGGGPSDAGTGGLPGGVPGP